MSICSATCKNGILCHHRAKPGHAVCGKHTAQDHPIVVDVCVHRYTSGRTCGQPLAAGHVTLCDKHYAQGAKKRERSEAMIAWSEVQDMLWVVRAPQVARDVLARMGVEGRMTVEWHAYYTAQFEAALVHYNVMFPTIIAKPVKPKSALHALATDRQNIHTTAVGKQTTEALELLLKTKVPKEQDTSAEIARSWSAKDKKTATRVGKDVRRWYTQPNCREDGDHLYQRALDGLWARIRVSKHKSDLVERLWEECNEADGMCCEGHIARLCNVMVGFDDAFKAEVPVGERLQQRMSAIAEKDVTTEHKIGAAWAVFEELKIPLEERSAWIEAF